MTKTTIAALLGSMLVSSTAYADSINFSVENDYSAVPVYIPEGFSYNNYLDINGQIGSRQAVAATLTAFFADDVDAIAYLGSTYGLTNVYTTPSYHGSDYHYVYESNYYYEDPMETASLFMNGETLGHVSSTSTNERNVLTYSPNHWVGNSESIYYGYENITKYSGLFSFSYILNQTQLDLLNANHGLGFVIDAGEGDFNYLGAKLDVNAVSSVPVPAALPLMASVLGLFGFARSRKAV